jgi:hypothetical protein
VNAVLIALIIAKIIELTKLDYVSVKNNRLTCSSCCERLSYQQNGLQQRTLATTIGTRKKREGGQGKVRLSNRLEIPYAPVADHSNQDTARADKLQGCALAEYAPTMHSATAAARERTAALCER